MSSRIDTPENPEGPSDVTDVTKPSSSLRQSLVDRNSKIVSVFNQILSTSHSKDVSAYPSFSNISEDSSVVSQLQQDIVRLKEQLSAERAKNRTLRESLDRSYEEKIVRMCKDMKRQHQIEKEQLNDRINELESEVTLLRSNPKLGFSNNSYFDSVSAIPKTPRPTILSRQDSIADATVLNLDNLDDELEEDLFA
ncbi:hypothetical protein P9112_009031 [Eukaryota sp. TZLM1-RC]